MADLFDVIADATRRDLLQVLLDRYISVELDSGEISVGDIVEQLGITQPTVSKHLKVLRDHELVTVREDGQHRYYRLAAAPLEEIEDWLVPFLSADFDTAETAGGEADDAGGFAVFAAWSGVDLGTTIGRRIAEGSHQARTVIHGASEQVTKRLPQRLRRGRSERP